MYRMHGAAGACGRARVVAKTNEERTGRLTDQHGNTQASEAAGRAAEEGIADPSFHATGNLFCFCWFDSLSSLSTVSVASRLTHFYRAVLLLLLLLLLSLVRSSGWDMPVVAGCGAACIRGDLAMATGANDPS